MHKFICLAKEISSRNQQSISVSNFIETSKLSNCEQVSYAAYTTASCIVFSPRLSRLLLVLSFMSDESKTRRKLSYATKTRLLAAKLWRQSFSLYLTSQQFLFAWKRFRLILAGGHVVLLHLFLSVFELNYFTRVCARQQIIVPTKNQPFPCSLLTTRTCAQLSLSLVVIVHGLSARCTVQQKRGRS